MSKKSIISTIMCAFLFLLLVNTMPAQAQIIEVTGGANYYNNSSDYWQTETEDLYYPGLGHKQYEILYQNGYRTNTTRYTGKYIFFPGESIDITTIEWRVSYDSYFTPNKGHKMFLTKWVNGFQTNETNYTGNYIVLSNETIDPFYREPNSSSDLYLNTTNTPLTTGLSGCDAYYLNTGNKIVKVHISVPYDYSLIIGGATVEGIKGSYTYYNQGEYNKTIKNGFAILVPKASLYNEFEARVNQAKNNGWACGNINWPSQY